MQMSALDRKFSLTKHLMGPEVIVIIGIPTNFVNEKKCKSSLRPHRGNEPINNKETPGYPLDLFRT